MRQRDVGAILHQKNHKLAITNDHREHEGSELFAPSAPIFPAEEAWDFLQLQIHKKVTLVDEMQKKCHLLVSRVYVLGPTQGIHVLGSDDLASLPINSQFLGMIPIDHALMNVFGLCTCP